MPVSRLRGMAGIGVDRMGQAADQSGDDALLRLENLDTDLRPPPGVVEATQEAATLDSANSYLPFRGDDALRQAVAARVGRVSGVAYDWSRSVILCAGGLNGILNVLLALLEPGDEVVMPDPIYIGLVNRVRLAGGVPVFVPYRIHAGNWRFDRAELGKRVTSRTRVFLMMSPSMPAGAVFTRADWDAICAACRDAGAWMLYDSAMEHILFDGLEPIHPASFPEMAERTITVGSVSKEYRMIGWRVGWIVAPPAVAEEIGLVSISNALSPVGIAQAAANVALRTPDADLAAATAEWQRRRDVLLDELAGLPVVKPLGGWSMLCDVSGFRLTGSEAAVRLFERARIAATPMTGWGSEGSARFIRFVYSNEPVARLRGIRARIEAAWR
jgi:N-succinyldiaminopimelate aminotransferase